MAASFSADAAPAPVVTALHTGAGAAGAGAAENHHLAPGAAAAAASMYSIEMGALIAFTFLAAGFIKGAIGMGLPIVVLTLLAATLGIREALALFLIPGIAANIWQMLSGPWLGQLFRRMWPFLLAAVGGIWLGTWVLANADTALLEALLGAVLIVYSVFSLLTPQLPPPGRREGWMSPLAGGAGGVVFGMTGIFIVPGILYLQTLGMKRDMFVQALGLTFITISTTLTVSMAGRDLVSVEEVLTSAAALVPTFLGLYLGRSVRHRISEAAFRQLFFVALIFSGLYMIVRALLLG